MGLGPHILMSIIILSLASKGNSKFNSISALVDVIYDYYKQWKDVSFSLLLFASILDSIAP